MNRGIPFLFGFILICACNSTAKKYDSPVGYDFNKPQKEDMPSELKEISGNAFYPGSKEFVYAIQDEDGKLFYWKNGNPASVQSFEFGKKGDYEDLGLTKDYVVVLRSDGSLFVFPFAAIAKNDKNAVTEYKHILPAGEYESINVDDDNGKIVILCKNCSSDRGEKFSVTGYELQLNQDGSLVLNGNFALKTSKIKDLIPKWKGNLKPSAVRFNSKTKEWFILASVNKLLVVTDAAWNIKQAIKLNPKTFPQPEGINFDIDNNLYISSEAGSTSTGTLLKFQHH